MLAIAACCCLILLPCRCVGIGISGDDTWEKYVSFGISRDDKNIGVGVSGDDKLGSAAMVTPAGDVTMVEDESTTTTPSFSPLLPDGACRQRAGGKLSQYHERKGGLCTQSSYITTVCNRLYHKEQEEPAELLFSYPFLHAVVSGCFEPQLLRDVREEVVAGLSRPSLWWEMTRTPSHNKKLSSQLVQNFGPASRTLASHITSPKFTQYVRTAMGIDDLTVDPSFSGNGGFHFIANGGHLGVHTDQNWSPLLHQYRRVIMLLFLNKGWQDSWGGHLKLFGQQMEAGPSIPPEFNTFVLLRSDDYSFHGHPEPLRMNADAELQMRGRISFAVYFYSNNPGLAQSSSIELSDGPLFPLVNPLMTRTKTKTVSLLQTPEYDAIKEGLVNTTTNSRGKLLHITRTGGTVQVIPLQGGNAMPKGCTSDFLEGLSRQMYEPHLCTALRTLRSFVARKCWNGLCTDSVREGAVIVSHQQQTSFQIHASPTLPDIDSGSQEFFVTKDYKEPFLIQRSDMIDWCIRETQRSRNYCVLFDTRLQARQDEYQVELQQESRGSTTNNHRRQIPSIIILDSNGTQIDSQLVVTNNQSVTLSFTWFDGKLSNTAMVCATVTTTKITGPPLNIFCTEDQVTLEGFPYGSTYILTVHLVSFRGLDMAAPVAIELKFLDSNDRTTNRVSSSHMAKTPFAHIQRGGGLDNVMVLHQKYFDDGPTVLNKITTDSNVTDLADMCTQCLKLKQLHNEDIMVQCQVACSSFSFAGTSCPKRVASVLVLPITRRDTEMYTLSFDSDNTEHLLLHINNQKEELLHFADNMELATFCTTHWAGQNFCDLLNSHIAHSRHFQQLPSLGPTVKICDRDSRALSDILSPQIQQSSTVVLSFVVFGIRVPEDALVQVSWTFPARSGEQKEKSFLIGSQKEISFSSLVSGQHHIVAVVVAHTGEHLGSSSSCIFDVELHSKSTLRISSDAKAIDAQIGTTEQWLRVIANLPRCSHLYWPCVLQNVLSALAADNITPNAQDLLVKGGLWAEFGTFEGTSLTDLVDASAQLFRHQPVLSFDSFRGLPSSWIPGWEQGALNLNGKVPERLRILVEERGEEAVQLVPGWFNTTVRQRLAQLQLLNPKSLPASVIHIDCDIYSSTREVLDALIEFGGLAAGTVLVFDEMINYHGFIHHEWKAWREVVATHNISFHFIFAAAEPVNLEILAQQAEYDVSGERYMTTSIGLVVDNITT